MLAAWCSAALGSLLRWRSGRPRPSPYYAAYKLITDAQREQRRAREQVAPPAQ